MATKKNPGKYDCYANAEDDEPLFVLLARDILAQYFVAAWAALRADDLAAAHRLMTEARDALKASGKRTLPYNSEKSIEAQQCAKSMRTWFDGKTLDAIEKRLKDE